MASYGQHQPNSLLVAVVVVESVCKMYLVFVCERMALAIAWIIFFSFKSSSLWIYKPYSCCMESQLHFEYLTKYSFKSSCGDDINTPKNHMFMDWNLAAENSQDSREDSNYLFNFVLHVTTSTVSRTGSYAHKGVNFCWRWVCGFFFLVCVLCDCWDALCLPCLSVSSRRIVLVQSPWHY